MDAFDKALTPMAKVEDRPGHPNDIADTILLLVQEKSRWITGQVRILDPLISLHLLAWAAFPYHMQMR